MPCIIIRTNVEIPSDRAKELKTALAVSWEKVPTKRERWLMIVMEDKQLQRQGYPRGLCEL